MDQQCIARGDDEVLGEDCLWIELRQRMRKARLTKLQKRYLEWHFRGFSCSEVALAYWRDESTVRRHVKKALERLEAMPDKGLLSMMIDQFGWGPVRDRIAAQRALGMLQLPRGWSVTPEGQLVRLKKSVLEENANAD